MSARKENILKVTTMLLMAAVLALGIQWYSNLQVMKNMESEIAVLKETGQQRNGQYDTLYYEYQELYNQYEDVKEERDSLDTAIDIHHAFERELAGR